MKLANSSTTISNIVRLRLLINYLKNIFIVSQFITLNYGITHASSKINLNSNLLNSPRAINSRIESSINLRGIRDFLPRKDDELSGKQIDFNNTLPKRFLDNLEQPRQHLVEIIHRPKNINENASKPVPQISQQKNTSKLSEKLKNQILAAQQNKKKATIHLLVKGALDHFQERQNIRRKFRLLDDRNNHEIIVHFLVGKELNKYEEIRKSHLNNLNNTELSVPVSIKNEIETYDDIIVGNFIDTYDNLVYKSLTGLEWFIRQTKSKRNNQYLMLIDDDVDLKIPELYKLIEKQQENTANKQQLFCPWKNARRARVSRRGPWGVPISIYPASHWPSYCGGACYLMNIIAAEQLYDSALNIKTFDVKVEDAFMTGVLRERARFELEAVNPICVHHVKEDSVTGRFIESQANQRGSLSAQKM